LSVTRPFHSSPALYYKWSIVTVRHCYGDMAPQILDARTWTQKERWKKGKRKRKEEGKGNEKWRGKRKGKSKERGKKR